MLHWVLSRKKNKKNFLFLSAVSAISVCMQPGGCYRTVLDALTLIGCHISIDLFQAPLLLIIQQLLLSHYTMGPIENTVTLISLLPSFSHESSIADKHSRKHDNVKLLQDHKLLDIASWKARQSQKGLILCIDKLCIKGSYLLILLPVCCINFQNASSKMQHISFYLRRHSATNSLQLY